MRQFATSLFWLALLAVVPGCALLGRPSDEPKKIYDRDWANSDDPLDRNAERASKDPARLEDEQRPTAKLLQGPPAGAAAEPDAKPGVTDTVTATPKKNPGTTGILTAENMLNPLGVTTAVAQASPVFDKKSELAPLTQAIQYMLDGRHQDAIAALRAYDEETQEFFLRILPPLTVFAKTPISKLSPQEIAVVDSLLTNLREVLRTRCELLVTKMSYCKAIHGHGNYDPLPDNHAFLNGTDSRPGERVQLYVELKNFASIKGEDGVYLTKLACWVDLHDANNQKIKSIPFDRKDTTYRRSACMNDYHGNFSFYVPPIPAGTYKLTLHIVDETIPNVRRLGYKSLDFRVTPVVNQTTLR